MVVSRVASGQRTEEIDGLDFQFTGCVLGLGSISLRINQTLSPLNLLYSNQSLKFIQICGNVCFLQTYSLK